MTIIEKNATLHIEYWEDGRLVYEDHTDMIISIVDDGIDDILTIDFSEIKKPAMQLGFA